LQALALRVLNDFGGAQCVIHAKGNLYYHPQRPAAAFLAMADRSSCVNFFARAAAPAFPDRTLPDGSFNLSSISPVAILATIIAAATVSAGRFWPSGPFGIIILRGRSHFP
jgi:hypothetical protein